MDGNYGVVLVAENNCGQDTTRMNVKNGTTRIQAKLSGIHSDLACACKKCFKG
jgi:hypothetical protein